MTREEAIRILDPKTSSEALAEIEYYNGFNGVQAKTLAVMEACEQGVAALREQEEGRKGCDLCNAKWIDIEARTVNPDDMYVFSTNEAIGLMFCPMCGRKLEVEG